jgi:hypothetical protein
MWALGVETMDAVMIGSPAHVVTALSLTLLNPNQRPSAQVFGAVPQTVETQTKRIFIRMMRQRRSGTGGSDKSNARPSQDYYGGYRGGSAEAGGGYGGSSQSSYGGYNAGSSSSYGGYSVPDAKQYSKSKKSSASLDSFLTNPLIFVCLLMAVWGIIVVVLWLNVRGKYNLILRELNAPNADVWMDKYKHLQLDLSSAQHEKNRSVRDKNREMNDKHDALDQENRKLQKECEDLRIKHEQSTEKGGTLHKLLREEAFDDQMERLEDAIRKESHRTALER